MGKSHPSHTVSTLSTNELIPAVGIGMPVYNGANYIREALDSLLAQTFTNFELIISDNASTDATQAICEEFARRDPRIRYVRQSENRGAMANFEFVLNQAKSEYFMWAAADDRWDEQWIESIYARVRGKNSLAGFGRLNTIDAYGAHIHHPAETANLSFSGNRIWRKLSFYMAYEGLGKPNLFYSLYPRKVLQSLDMHSYDFDYQILFALLDQIAFVQINGPALHKRIHVDSEGSKDENTGQYSRFFSPVMGGLNIIRMGTHYLRYSGPILRTVLLLLLPIKVMGSLFTRLLTWTKG